MILAFKADLGRKAVQICIKVKEFPVGEGIEILILSIKRFRCTRPSLRDWNDLV